MENIKVGDKIVYDRMATTNYILVKEIKTLKTDDKGTVTLINMIYSITGPLRSPTKRELEVENFK